MADPTAIASTALTAGSAAFPPLAIAELGLGAIQTGVSLARLKKLRDEEMASYNDNLAPLQQNVNMFQNEFNHGLPQAYVAQAYGANAAQNASAYRRIQDVSGGQLGNAFSRIAAMDRIRLGLSLASASADYRRSIMGQLSEANRSITNQKNLQTGQDLRYRMMQEQALGGALKSGTENLAGAIDYSIVPQFLNPQSPQPVAPTPGLPVAPAQTPQPIGPQTPNVDQFGNFIPDDSLIQYQY